MSRYVSFRDFDWVLLVLVLLICALGVVEIYSATLSTKFVGVHLKQMYWILGGVALMFIVSVLNYQALLERVPLIYLISIGSLLAVALFGHKSSRRAALGAAGLLPLSAVGVGEAGPDPCHGKVFCRHEVGMHGAGHRQSRSAGGRSHADGAGAARSRHRAYLPADRDYGPVSGRNEGQARGGHFGDRSAAGASGVACAEAVSARPADQLHPARSRRSRPRISGHSVAGGGRFGRDFRQRARPTAVRRKGNFCRYRTPTSSLRPSRRSMDS